MPNGGHILFTKISKSSKWLEKKVGIEEINLIECRKTREFENCFHREYWFTKEKRKNKLLFEEQTNQGNARAPTISI